MTAGFVPLLKPKACLRNACSWGTNAYQWLLLKIQFIWLVSYLSVHCCCLCTFIFCIFSEDLYFFRTRVWYAGDILEIYDYGFFYVLLKMQCILILLYNVHAFTFFFFFGIFMIRTDMTQSYRFLGPLQCPDFSFIRSRVGCANGNTDQSTHTSVLCDETPAHQSRSSAVPKLSLLSEQGAVV